MTSIKKRIIKKRLIITISLLVSVVLIIFVICILPSGVHKNNISSLAIPKDVDLYVSSGNINKTILNMLNSNILNKELTSKLDAMIKNATIFSNTTLKDEALLEKYTSSIMLDFFGYRGAAIMLWGNRQSDDLSASRKYLLFDIGLVPMLIFDTMLDDGQQINISNKYRLNKTLYHGINVYSYYQFGQSGRENTMYFVIHARKLIFTDTLEGVKKIAEHLSSNISSISERAYLDNMKTKKFSDISFYMNEYAYQRLFNIEIDVLKEQDFSTLYGDITFQNGKIDLNMHLRNKNRSNTSHRISKTY